MVGGIESVVLHLATALHERGESVCVVTRTASAGADALPFPVLRTKQFWPTYRIMRRADAVVQFNVSLKGVVLALLARRPLVLTHHAVYPKAGWNRLKWFVTYRLARINTGCSAFVANQYPSAVVLPNPYDEAVFRLLPNAARSSDLVFLGRLVTEKGCDVLLRAVKTLRRKYGQQPTVTLIGDGPEKPRLAQLVGQLGLSEQVQFLGTRTGHELAALLNGHRILIVPSVYEEPFGLVALEGMACGCFVIGAHAGGLPEAIGPGGATFPPGDAGALADAIHQALDNPADNDNHRQRVAEHLRPHTRPAAAEQFLTLMNQTFSW